jgi:hypothetical protein
MVLSHRSLHPFQRRLPNGFACPDCLNRVLAQPRQAHYFGHSRFGDLFPSLR